MASSNTDRERIKKLFVAGAELIPPEILDLVETILDRAQRRYYLNHETFEDLVEDCLVDIWKLEDKFNSKPLAYFAKVVNNKVADCCREQAELSRVEAKPEEFFSIIEREVKNDALSQMYSRVELDQLIHTVLDKDEVEVITLKFYAGWTLNRIAARLKVSQSTVNRLYSAALLKLRSKLRSGAFRKA